MKVKEIIEKLNTYNPEANFCIVDPEDDNAVYFEIEFDKYQNCLCLYIMKDEDDEDDEDDEVELIDGFYVRKNKKEK